MIGAVAVGLLLPGTRRAMEVRRERAVEREQKIASGTMVDESTVPLEP